MAKPTKTPAKARRGPAKTPEEVLAVMEAVVRGERPKPCRRVWAQWRERAAKATSALAPEGYALTKTRLSERLGVHRHTITAALEDPRHPKRGPLGFDVAACRAYYVARGTIGAGANGSGRAAEVVEAEAKRALAEARKETARAELLEHNVATAREKVVAVETVNEFFGNVATEVVARLRTVGQNVVAALKLDAATAAAVADRVDAEVREGLSKLAEFPWLPEDEKKKLRAGCLELPGTFRLAFGPPAESPPPLGRNVGSNSTQATPFRVAFD
jgi:hypothetical protein